MQTLQIEVLSIFPDIFRGFLETSLIEKAISAGLLKISCTDFRQFADPPHYSVDDSPYGGGAGMVLKPEPLARAIKHAKTNLPNARVILMSAAGQTFSQVKAKQLSEAQSLILVCGRYEGVDQRFIDLYIDEEISVGDYIVMGGEVPAMLIIEAVTRLIPGVVGNAESVVHESYATAENLLEAPQYTRPPEFEGRTVPEVLTSGNHKAIAEWRHKQSLLLTEQRRAKGKYAK